LRPALDHQAGDEIGEPFFAGRIVRRARVKEDPDRGRGASGDRRLDELAVAFREVRFWLLRLGHDIRRLRGLLCLLGLVRSMNLGTGTEDQRAERREPRRLHFAPSLVSRTTIERFSLPMYFLANA